MHAFALKLSVLKGTTYGGWCVERYHKINRLRVCMAVVVMSMFPPFEKPLATMSANFEHSHSQKICNNYPNIKRR